MPDTFFFNYGKIFVPPTKKEGAIRSNLEAEIIQEREYTFLKNSQNRPNCRWDQTDKLSL